MASAAALGAVGRGFESLYSDLLKMHDFYLHSLAWIHWDPPRFAFTIPLINRDIAWYGVFFSLGFILGFFILIPLFEALLAPFNSKGRKSIRQEAIALTDRITWFVVLGTLFGARLGHVLFYDWPRYERNLLGILKVWEGGLASHGGTIGILIAIGFYVRSVRNQYPQLTFTTVLDLLCIPTALAGAFIRIGNFFNQEILGPVTSQPWGIVFGHPYEGGPALPRHPAQLYEAMAYFVIFGILSFLWISRRDKLKRGFLIGIFMISIFGARFLIEFVKTPQSLVLDESILSAGQLLSLPFILLGCFFLFRARCEAQLIPSREIA